MNLRIRPENPLDPTELAAIRVLNRSAFNGTEEADLVDHLRSDGFALLSLVAEIDGRIAGHIMFSRMWIDGPAESLPAVSLAPVAVAPEYQRHGIGSQLVQQGLDHMRTSGEAIVIVLGHPNYYPKFGFSAAIAASLESPFAGEAFMALELKPGALNGVTGRVRYAPPFGL